VKPRTAQLACVAVLAAFTALAVQIELTTPVRNSGGVYIAFGLTVVWSFAIAGLVAWRRRPGNRTGFLMMLVGFTWLLSALADSTNDLVFAIGIPLGSLWAAVLIHLLLAYPSGRLDRRSRWIVVAGYVDTVGMGLLMLPFTEPRVEGQGVSPKSASNALLVTHKPDLVSVMESLEFIVAIVLVSACLIMVLRRWRTAAPGVRRVLAPLYLTGAFAIGVILVVVVGSTVVGSASSSVPFFAFSVSFTLIPIGYLFGILRTRLDRSAAVETLTATLREQRSPGGVRDALALALNDGSLDLAYRRRGSEEYVDVRGAHYDLPADAAGRAVTPIEREGEVVAAIVHDPFLLDEPGLIHAVCGPAALAIENERLQADLRAQVQEATAAVRRLRDVLENVHLLAVRLDLDGRITFCNQCLADVTGWSREELIGRRWLERFPTGDPEYLDRIRQEQILVHDERPLLTRTGELRDISWSNTLDRDANGVVVGSTSIGEDVTDRNRRAREEAALRRVATMVAAEAAPEQVFATVTRDVAGLFGGQTANLARFDDQPPTTGVVIAGWSEPGVVSMPVGDRVTFDGPTAVGAVIRSGRTARIDDYSEIDGELAERLRGMGLRSSVAAPITVDGRLWGAITVSTTGNAVLAADVEDRIGQFTELLALGLQSAEGKAQLAASRARIVAAGDAERRRLERNLHDGAQQRLVALSLALRMARSTVDSEHPAAELLDSSGDELMQALEELRELARGIHPAILSDQGLKAAVGAAAGRSPAPVDLTIDLGVELPPAIEAAAYYVVSEALTNVAKYADATAVDVRITSGPAGVDVAVSDNGAGGADPAAGTGLRGLADRVEALGGTLHVGGRPGGGTTVSAHVPLGAPAPAPLAHAGSAARA